MYIKILDTLEKRIFVASAAFNFSSIRTRNKVLLLLSMVNNYYLKSLNKIESLKLQTNNAKNYIRLIKNKPGSIKT